MQLFGLAHARQLARSLLLSQKLARLPICVERMRFDEKQIVIDSLEHYCVLTAETIDKLCAGNIAALRDGCTLVRQRGNRRIYVILYNARAASRRRRSFTLAHEIGHIYLEHQDDSPASERQANAFAAELLMPRVLAFKYISTLPPKVDRPSALAEAFGVSLSMAYTQLSAAYPGITYTEQEKQLLARYKTALPYPNEPEVRY